MNNEKLARLPKWAQSLIRDQARRIDERDELIASLREENTVPEWHDWEFSTYDSIGKQEGDRVRNEFPKRYINASTIRLRHNGIECELSARGGEIRLSFDLDRDMPHPGYDTKVVIVPDASNCLKLARMQKSDAVHTFDAASEKA